MKKAILIVAALCAAIAVPIAAAHGGKGKGTHKGHRPDVIQLPVGFQPEGIATGRRATFYVGSVGDGAIYRGSLRSGEGAVLVPGAAGRSATGMKLDRRHRLFVSGAGSKFVRVYDARTGAELRSYPVPDSGFINDVVVTRRGAYFTDSGVAQLYFIPFGDHGALGELQRIPITGDFEYGTGLNANGIAATRGGKTLISVKTSTGELFAIDAATGASRKIAVTGAEGTDGELVNGDGLLRQGRKLYVVENRDTNEGTDAVGEVSVVKLERNLRSGRIVREIVDSDFAVPTTMARSGGRNYVVNAKFGSPTPTTETYQVVKVPRR